MLQSLVRDYEISVLSWDGLECESANLFFGTSLRAVDFTAHRVSRWIRFVVDSLPWRMDQLRIALLVRRSRGIRARQHCDLCVTASNEIDFGVPGVVYVHYPWGAWARPSRGLVELLYRALCHRVAASSAARMRENRMVTSSSFVAEKIRVIHGIEPIVVSPPVAGPFPEVPWEQRSDRLVCVGRLHPEKKLLEIVEIVSRLRAIGHDVGLDIVGMRDDPVYAEQVEALAGGRSWVRIHHDLSRGPLVRLLTSTRYGIHGMRDEGFGMSVAEMLSAGCIVFVPDRGGPVEIVDGEPCLLYGSVAEAVERIGAVLGDPERQLALRRKLTERRGAYTTERFEESIRTVVADYLVSRAEPA